jgi:methyltransferase OMS1
MGLNLIRWWNIRKAKGKVLEIGCGTGRNMSYYNFSQVSKLIAIDSVKEMIDVARTKIPSSLDDPSQVQLKQMNAHDLREFADNSFDTVVDTFGLCSYQSPHKVLHELSRVLNKANPDARIILIEHGHAHYDWLNNSLNSRGQQHAHDWGCVWNLPIDQIVQEAGLEIVSMSRFHMGTTYVIEARPAPPGAPHARSLHEYHSHYQPPPRPDDPATHRHVEVHPPAELDDHGHSHGHPHPPAAPAHGPSPSSSQQHPR